MSPSSLGENELKHNGDKKPAKKALFSYDLDRFGDGLDV